MLFPAVASSGAEGASWRSPGQLALGSLGEGFMRVTATAVVVFALSLNLKVYFVVLTSSFVVYAISLAISKRLRIS